ncbi:glycosyltransferase family 2 protein [Phormidium sp. CLA17]|uniref:glycosyltransferase family 2 protein n=1 Tax=Leptolyngbya sp. Cla-17 TaxID=2803751 RepID=UPI001490ED50|nr:glycosyltransferase [Leptolyngbya sp. Cla-17]MBM0740292.1 glycosyltransferase family 2 protein [Leptolyngbya sp. Cla-17]
MKLSVILPCFNGAKTIAIQLEALTHQSWDSEWEVVVVNNGSTDTSMEIVERYRDRLPNLQIVNAYQPNTPRRGVTHSYAVGWQTATGDAFLLCEADDEVGEGWLLTLGNALKAHPFVAAAIDYTKLNPDWLVSDGWQQQSAQAGLSTISPPLYLPYASGCSLGLRRSVYEAIGNPDETCTASWDTDYCWRANLAGIPIQFVPNAIIHYRLRTELGDRYRQGKNWGLAHVVLDQKYGSSITRLRVFKHYGRSMLKLFKQLLSLFPHLTRRKGFTQWIWGFGWCVGDLQGGRHLWANVFKGSKG